MPSTPVKFDYAGARRAGFTDEQIAQSLAAKRAAGMNVVVDRAEVDSVRGTPQVTAPAAGTEPSLSRSFDWGRVGEVLPTVGGTIGGLAGMGTPARIPLAAAGGAAGEAAREALMGEALSGGSIAKRGAEQGAYELAGGLVAKGASKLARPIMRSALRLGKPIAGEVKVGAELYPDPVETALREGIEVNERGALKANALRKSVGSDIGSLLRKEGAAGREFKTSEVLKYAKELLKDKSLSNSQRAKIFNELVTFYKEKGARMDPELVQLVKRREGGKYKGWNKGRDPLTEPVMGEVAGEISRGAGEALDAIPGMAGLNRKYAAAKGAQKAVTNAVRRPDPLWQVQAPATYPVLRGVLGNKSLNSQVAIKLADPKWQALYRQSPRLFFALVGQGMYSAEPDVTE